MRKTVLFVTVAVVLTAAAAIGAWAGSAAPDPGDGFVVAGDDEKGGIGSVPSRGVVRSWDLENMRGVIDSDDVPGGCHISFVAVAVDGFPGLTQGQQVEFEWTRLDTPEAGFAFECVRVWPAGRPTPGRPVSMRGHGRSTPTAASRNCISPMSPRSRSRLHLEQPATPPARSGCGTTRKAGE